MCDLQPDSVRCSHKRALSPTGVVRRALRDRAPPRPTTMICVHRGDVYAVSPSCVAAHAALVIPIGGLGRSGYWRRHELITAGRARDGWPRAVLALGWYAIFVLAGGSREGGMTAVALCWPVGGSTRWCGGASPCDGESVPKYVRPPESFNAFTCLQRFASSRDLLVLFH